MLESIKIKNPSEIDISLQTKLQANKFKVKNFLEQHNNLICQYTEFKTFIEESEIDLSEKEYEYLISTMKKDHQLSSIYSLSLDYFKNYMNHYNKIDSVPSQVNKLESIHDYNKEVYYSLEEDISNYVYKSIDEKFLNYSVNSLIEKLSKFLNENLISLEDFLEHEIVFIHHNNKESQELKKQGFHINSLLRKMLQLGVINEIMKSDVFNICYNFKMNILNSEENLVSNTSAFGFIDLIKFDEAVKSPKLTEEDKNFYIEVIDYLEKKQISFKFIKFMLQLKTKILKREDINFETLSKNKYLIHCMHNNKFKVISKSILLDFLRNKGINSQIPGIYIIEIHNENLVNLTLLDEKLKNIKISKCSNTKPSNNHNVSNKPVNESSNASKKIPELLVIESERIEILSEEKEKKYENLISEEIQVNEVNHICFDSNNLYLDKTSKIEILSNKRHDQSFKNNTSLEYNINIPRNSLLNYKPDSGRYCHSEIANTRDNFSNKSIHLHRRFSEQENNNDPNISHSK